MQSLIHTQCILCGTNAHTRVKYKQNFSEQDLNADIFSARRTTEHYHYQILECEKCSMVFSSPVLPHEKIEGLYKKSKLTYGEEIKYITETYISYIRNNIHLFHTKQKALEIGCGSGFFLNALKSVGFEEVYGVEPSVDAVSKSGELKSHIFNGFFEHANYKDNSFDLIACFQTLDHLMDPLKVLNRCHSLLKPGGKGYFIMHDEKGLQAKIFGEKSPIYDVEHIYLFNKKILAEVTEKAGFKVLHIFDVKNIYPLSYWLRMAPLPFKGGVTKLAGLLNLLKLNIGFKAGNIGIFVEK